MPRPEWYFFFLFELLKIFKGQNALMPVIMATFIIPNILMILLIITPFIDRGPERRIQKRPIALISGIAVIVFLAYLTNVGASSNEGVGAEGLPITVDNPTAKAGEALFLANGCTVVPSDRRSGGARSRAQPHRRGHQGPSAGVVRGLPEGPARRRDAQLHDLHPRAVQRAGDLPQRARHRVQVGATVRDRPDPTGRSSRRGTGAPLPSDDLMRVFLGITGASGAIYGGRALNALTAAGCDVGLCISDAGAHVISHEILEAGVRPPDDPALVVATFIDRFAASPGTVTLLGLNDLTAPFASGSSLAPAALIAPCSGSTLGAIAHGTARNLIHRCADVMLKERRRLVLMPRETPLSLIQIENMAAVTRAGAVVMPAMPGFYGLPREVGDLVDFMVAKALDHLGVPNDLIARWGEDAAQRRERGA